MSGEANKAIIRRYFDEVWNGGNLDLIDQFFAPDYVNHSPSPGQGQGSAALKALIAMFRGAAPDLRITVDDLLAEGDRVASRWTARGTHTGEGLLGLPPTGRVIVGETIAIDRFADGRIVEHWARRDDLGLFQQLGLLPPLPSAAERGHR